MSENFAKVWLFGISLMLFFSCFLSNLWIIGVIIMLVVGIVKIL